MLLELRRGVLARVMTQSEPVVLLFGICRAIPSIVVTVVSDRVGLNWIAHVIGPWPTNGTLPI